MKLSKICMALAAVSLAPSVLADYTEDFSNGLNGFTAVSLKSDAPHNWSLYSNHDYSGAKLEWVTLDGHGFDFPTATVESDDWLVSPRLKLSDTDTADFSFKSRLQYFGRNITAYISSDYDGDVENFEDATWTELTVPNLPADPGWSGDFTEWTDSGAISLTGYEGQEVYVAIRYVADESAVADADANIGQWEIDDIAVTNATKTLPTFVEDFSDGLGEISAVSVKSDAPHNWSNYANHDEAGDKLDFVTLDGHGFDFPTETVESDDWLITPKLTVSQSDDANFSFDSRLQYFGRNISAWISTDYDGEDPSIATWTELTVPTLPADPGWSGEFTEWTNSGAISLADYKGQDVYLAVRYVATADDVADADASIGQWEIDNIKAQGAFASYTEEFIFGLGTIEAVSLKSDAPHNWSTFANNDESTEQLPYATIDGHGFDFGTATVESDDWLITPSLVIEQTDEASFSFNSRVQYNGRNLSAYISTDYDGDAAAATWTELTIPTLPEDQGLSGAFSEWTNSGAISLAAYQNQTVFIGIRFQADETQIETPDDNVGQWEVDDIVVKGGKAAISYGPYAPKTAINFTVTPPPQGGVVDASLTFSATATSKIVDEADYDYHWDFGNGDTATGQTVNYAYSAAGTYTPTLTVSYAGGDITVQNAEGEDIAAVILPEELTREGDAIFITEAYVPPVDDTPADDSSEDNDEVLGLTFGWPMLVFGLLGLRRRKK